MRTRIRSVLLAVLLVASVVGAATAPTAAQPAPSADASQDDAVEQDDTDDETVAASGGIGHQISVYVLTLVGADPGPAMAQETPEDPNENDTDAGDETDAGNETDAVSVTDYDVANGTVPVDQPVTITATVENTGDVEATTEVAVTVDDQVVETSNVTVAANATETVTVETSVDAAGEHAVAVGDLAPTTVVVEAPTPDVGAIAGTVTDNETDEPIANASVDVTANASATTGPNGTYEIGDVPVGTHDVTVDADGYDAATQSVAVEANETATADAALEASADEEPAPTADELDVVLDGAPEGLQAYEATVSLSEDANASIAAVESDLIASSRLQVTDRSDDTVTFRAADLGDAVGAFEDARVLASVELNGSVAADQADVTVEKLTDDAGNEIDESRLSLVLDGPLFAEPLPGSDGEAPPTDVDGDRLYEDVDGDGDADFDDAVALAFVDGEALTDDQRAALDFDGNGEFAFADAVELAFQV